MHEPKGAAPLRLGRSQPPELVVMTISFPRVVVSSLNRLALREPDVAGDDRLGLLVLRNSIERALYSQAIGALRLNACRCSSHGCRTRAAVPWACP